MEPSQHDLGVIDNAKLPHGWKVEPLPDGSLKLITTEVLRARYKGSVPVCIVWNIGILIAIVLVCGLLPGRQVLWGLLFLLPFAIVGLVITHTAFVAKYGIEEYIVGPNRLEHRTGHQFLKELHSRSIVPFRNGHFALEAQPVVFEADSVHGKLTFSWHLLVKWPGTTWNQHGIEATFPNANCTFEQLHYLGVVLSEKTGWLLDAPSEHFAHTPQNHPEQLDQPQT